MADLVAPFLPVPFFACGCLQEPHPAGLAGKLAAMGDRVRRIDTGVPGESFYVQSDTANVAENEQLICIKLGLAHDGDRLLATHELLERGLVGLDGVKAEAIRGNATLVVLSKLEPRCFIYRNIPSLTAAFYWTDGRNFLATDNLRLMAELIPDRAFNEAVLPLHLMYRGAYGRPSYLRGVSKLLVGEQVAWAEGRVSVQLRRDLRGFFPDPTDQQPVTPQTANAFFEQLAGVLGIYIREFGHASATMLSGGIDSSLMQLAILAQPEIDFRYPSISFVMDTPTFTFEREYAQEAADLLGTDHSFVPISPSEYVKRLIQSIEILGQPVPDDVRLGFLVLAAHIAERRPQLRFLFHGQVADGLHGDSYALKVVQGDKYRRWPVPLLQLIALGLAPISHSKSYGARMAAETLAMRKRLNSPMHHINTVGMYTDWELMARCFPKQTLAEALSVKRDMEARYLGSDIMVEQYQMVDFLTDSTTPASLVYQLGLFHDRQFIFPYADAAVLQASFLFDPMHRYTAGNRIKPVLKSALEQRLPSIVTEKPKGWSGVGDDLWDWMRQGDLRDLVHAIERPPFLDRREFERKIEQPDWFTWNLLTLDVFKKYVLERQRILA